MQYIGIDIARHDEPHASPPFADRLSDRRHTGGPLVSFSPLDLHRVTTGQVLHIHPPTRQPRLRRVQLVLAGFRVQVRVIEDSRHHALAAVLQAQGSADGKVIRIEKDVEVFLWKMFQTRRFVVYARCME